MFRWSDDMDKNNTLLPIGNTGMTLCEEESDLISKALLVYIRDLSEASRTAYDKNVADRCEELMDKCNALNYKFCQLSNTVWTE